LVNLISGALGNLNFHTSYSLVGAEYSELVLASIIEIIYMVITAIVTVNLLIAMLSQTYDNVRERALILWSIQFAHTLKKFRGTTWPPPFTIFGYFYHFMRNRSAPKIDKDNSKNLKVTQNMIRLYNQSITELQQ